MSSHISETNRRVRIERTAAVLNRINEIRLRYNLTMHELAAETNLCVSTLWNWEKGKFCITDSTFHYLTKKLDEIEERRTYTLARPASACVVVHVKGTSRALRVDLDRDTAQKVLRIAADSLVLVDEREEDVLKNFRVEHKKPGKHIGMTLRELLRRGGE